MPKWPFDQVADPSDLTDADWLELNKLKAAYESSGSKALDKAFAELAADPIRYCTVVAALFPDMMREQIKDTLAERGITEDDLRELLEQAKRKMESPSSEQH